jgi:phytoene/squalene synthetase
MSIAAIATAGGRGSEVSVPGSVPDSSTLAPGLRLLPEPTRTDVYRLYHVLRRLDDVVDEDRDDAQERVEAVER